MSALYWDESPCAPGQTWNDTGSCILKESLKGSQLLLKPLLWRENPKMQWHKSWDIFKLSAVLHLLLAFSTPVHSIKCYECDPEDDYICSPTELFGEPVQCADDVITCHKGFTVEANNKITRSCGDPRDEPDEDEECPMVHEIDGKDRKISCHCGTDLCNTAWMGTRIQYWLCPVSLLLSLVHNVSQ